MEAKKLILFLLCSLTCSNNIGINPDNIPSGFRWLITLGLPAILGVTSNKLTDDEEHINNLLLYSSCGSALASFDQIKNLNPKPSQMFLDTLKNALALYVTNYLYILLNNRVKSETSRNKRTIKGKLRIEDITDLLQFVGIVNDTFPGEIAKDMIVYQSVLLLLSKLYSFKESFKQ